MIKPLPLSLAAAALATAMMMPLGAQATPAFSRQIHADCRTCHFQGMHALNAYGRAFKMNGFHETRKMREQRLQREKQRREQKAEKQGGAER